MIKEKKRKAKKSELQRERENEKKPLVVIVRKTKNKQRERERERETPGGSILFSRVSFEEFNTYEFRKNKTPITFPKKYGIVPFLLKKCVKNHTRTYN